MLSRYENNGIELVIDNETGKAYATQSGYVTMSKKAKSTISERVEKLVRLGEIETAEMDTGYGIKLVRLIPAELVFDWMWNDNPELAKEMGKAGATVFLYKVAGYQVKVEEPKQEPQPQLPPILPVDHALKYMDLLDRYKAHFGGVNPTIEQTIKDGIGNALTNYTPQLEGKKELWMGVVSFAEVELGYQVPRKGEFRASALGKWVRFYYPELSDNPIGMLRDRQELRLCNETQQEIWVYPVHECRAELESAVRSFFEDAAPGTKLKLDGAFKRS